MEVFSPTVAIMFYCNRYISLSSSTPFHAKTQHCVPTYKHTHRHTHRPGKPLNVTINKLLEQKNLPNSDFAMALNNLHMNTGNNIHAE